jgi:hypothetical protein
VRGGRGPLRCVLCALAPARSPSSRCRASPLTPCLWGNGIFVSPSSISSYPRHKQGHSVRGGRGPLRRVLCANPLPLPLFHATVLVPQAPPLSGAGVISYAPPLPLHARAIGRGRRCEENRATPTRPLRPSPIPLPLFRAAVRSPSAHRLLRAGELSYSPPLSACIVKGGRLCEGQGLTPVMVLAPASSAPHSRCRTLPRRPVPRTVRRRLRRSLRTPHHSTSPLTLTC